MRSVKSLALKVPDESVSLNSTISKEAVGRAPASIVFPSDNVMIKCWEASIDTPVIETPSVPSVPSAPAGPVAPLKSTAGSISNVFVSTTMTLA